MGINHRFITLNQQVLFVIKSCLLLLYALYKLLLLLAV